MACYGAATGQSKGHKRYVTVILSDLSVISHSPKAVEALRTSGKKLLFLTNNASKSRAAYAKRFSSLGIKGVGPDDVVSSSYSAARYLHEIGFKKKVRTFLSVHCGLICALWPPKPASIVQVFLIGTQGIEDELNLFEISFLGGSNLQQAPPHMGDSEAMLALKVR